MEQFLRVNITGDSKKLNQSLKSASSNLKSFGSKLSSIGANLSLRVTAPLGLAGGAAIKMASDFQESLNKVDVAFKGSSKEVRDFAKTTLREFGIARGTALDMAALFGDMATSMGLTTGEAAKMSTSLVGLAGDLASFKNMNIEEVTTALNGVFTGETESLKRLGIVMTEVNLKQFAMEQGIKKNIKEMTQAEKVALRFQYVLSTTGNAQGDFARTSGGAANQMRIFQESLKEVGANFGNLLLPLFTDFVKKANGFITAFGSMSRESKVLALQIAAVAAALPLVITAVGGLATAFGFLLTPLGLAVAAFATVIYYFDEIVNFTVKVRNSLLKNIGYALIKIEEYFKKYLVRPIKYALKALDEITKDPLNFDLSKIKEEFDQEGKDITKEAHEAIDKNLAEAAKREGLPEYENIIGKLVKKVMGKAPVLGSIGQGGAGGGDASAPDFSGFQADTSALEVKPKTLNTWKSLNAAINKSREAMDGVKKKRDEMKQEHDALKSQIQGELAPAFGELGSAIKTNLKLGDSAIGKFAGNMIDLAMSVISSALAASTAAAIQGAAQGSLLSGPAAPFVIGGLIAAAVGTVASAFSSNVPALASGGIAKAPTLAMVGDNYGANRGNPEVIAPLNKLEGMMAGGNRNINVGGEFRVQGQDLVVALQRAERHRNRIL
jgi:hypothetical protein